MTNVQRLHQPYAHMPELLASGYTGLIEKCGKATPQEDRIAQIKAAALSNALAQYARAIGFAGGLRMATAGKSMSHDEFKGMLESTVKSWAKILPDSFETHFRLSTACDRILSGDPAPEKIMKMSDVALGHAYMTADGMGRALDLISRGDIDCIKEMADHFIESIPGEKIRAKAKASVYGAVSAFEATIEPAAPTRPH